MLPKRILMALFSCVFLIIIISCDDISSKVSLSSSESIEIPESNTESVEIPELNTEEIHIGETKIFRLSTGTDENWICFNALQGKNYKIETKAVSEDTESDADTIISLLNEKMELLSQNDDMDNTTSNNTTEKYILSKIYSLIPDYITGNQNDLFDFIMGKENKFDEVIKGEKGFFSMIEWTALKSEKLYVKIIPSDGKPDSLGPYAIKVIEE